MTAPTTVRTPCAAWCRDDHRLAETEPDAVGDGDLFHRSAGWRFEVTHSETTTPETCGVMLARWTDAVSDGEQPARVVLDLGQEPSGIAVDCFGETWLTAAQARALAGHLSATANTLDTALTRTTQARINDLARQAITPVTDEQRQAATVLLADLYETGERHGIDPEDWANVTAMPSAALDVVRASDRRRGAMTAPKAER